MAIYEVKLNRYSPHIKRHIPNDLVSTINNQALEYVTNECKIFDKNATVIDGKIHANVASYLVINITSNFRTRLLERNEQEFLSTRLD